MFPVFHTDLYLVLLMKETGERHDNDTEGCLGEPRQRGVGGGIELPGPVRGR